MVTSEIADTAIAIGNAYERIYAVVKRIPRGRVATYGQVASLAGIPGHARQVGYALSALSHGDGLVWHRVVNAKGEISARARPAFERIQRARLEREGVVFGPDARISLRRFQMADCNSMDHREIHSKR